MAPIATTLSPFNKKGITRPTSRSAYTGGKLVITKETAVGSLFDSCTGMASGLNVVIFDYARFTERHPLPESYLTMLAAEDILCKDWDTPEEDEAWANL